MFFYFCVLLAAIFISILMTPTKPQEPLSCSLDTPPEPQVPATDDIEFFSYEETLAMKTLAELKAIAKTNGIKVPSKARKAIYVERLASAIAA